MPTPTTSPSTTPTPTAVLCHHHADPNSGGPDWCSCSGSNNRYTTTAGPSDPCGYTTLPGPLCYHHADLDSGGPDWCSCSGAPQRVTTTSGAYSPCGYLTVPPPLCHHHADPHNGSPNGWFSCSGSQERYKTLTGNNLCDYTTPPPTTATITQTPETTPTSTYLARIYGCFYERIIPNDTGSNIIITNDYWSEIDATIGESWQRKDGQACEALQKQTLTKPGSVNLYAYPTTSPIPGSFWGWTGCTYYDQNAPSAGPGSMSCSGWTSPTPCPAATTVKGSTCYDGVYAGNRPINADIERLPLAECSITAAPGYTPTPT